VRGVVILATTGVLRTPSPDDVAAERQASIWKESEGVMQADEFGRRYQERVLLTAVS